MSALATPRSRPRRQWSRRGQGGQKEVETLEGSSNLATQDTDRWEVEEEVLQEDTTRQVHRRAFTALLNLLSLLVIHPPPPANLTIPPLTPRPTKVPRLSSTRPRRPCRSSVDRSSTTARRSSTPPRSHAGSARTPAGRKTTRPTLVVSAGNGTVDRSAVR